MKKHPRLPVGFGTIRYLGGKRSKPYAVHPPSTERSQETGLYIRPPALCYVSSWYVGMSVLSAYHAGNYKPGDELTMEKEFSKVVSETGLNDFCQRLLDNFAVITGRAEAGGMTFSEIYQEFFLWKYGEHASKRLSSSSRKNCSVAFGHLERLHNRPINTITLNQMQAVINALPYKRSTVSACVQLLKQVFAFAVPRDYCRRDLARYVVVPDRPDYTHYEAFTDAELKTMWAHKDNPTIAFILIMCYSGFRVSAYETITVNLEEAYFQGGIKTPSGMNRIVPIHSAILPLVRRFGAVLTIPQGRLRLEMKSALCRISVRTLTPHSCRHTFSRLCETFGVNEVDRKRMLGHAVPDITNSVYGHRSLEELRSEIEKIKVT